MPCLDVISESDLQQMTCPIIPPRPTRPYSCTIPRDISHKPQVPRKGQAKYTRKRTVSFSLNVPTNRDSASNDIKAEEDNLSMRTNVVNTLYSSEVNYTSCLKVVVEIWIGQLRSNPAFDLNLVKSLFSNIEVILNVNLQFLKEIEKKVADWSDDQTIADVFLTLVPFFKIYMQYINNYNQAIDTFQMMMKKKNFKAYVKSCISKGGPFDNLPSYLITPIQRIPKYQLLLQELLMYTPDSHSDFNHIKLSLEQIANVAECLNSQKKDAESIDQCANIQMRVFYPNGRAKPIEFVSPKRRYKRENTFELYINGNCLIYNQIVLFNDSLLFVRNKKNRLLFGGFLAINRTKITVESNIFLIDVTSLGVTIRALLIDGDHNEWINDLSEKYDGEVLENDEMDIKYYDRSDHQPISPRKSFKERFLAWT